MRFDWRRFPKIKMVASEKIMLSERLAAIASDSSFVCGMGKHSIPSPTSGREEVKRVLLSRAKEMRSHQTDAEQRLWYFFRAKRFMGLTFKRQKPIGFYIADFVCMRLKLIVEADGGQHGNARDEIRNTWFSAQGFSILHFWNHVILTQTELVLEHVRKTALMLQAATLSLSPSPVSGRGEQEVLLQNTASFSRYKGGGRKC